MILRFFHHLFGLWRRTRTRKFLELVKYLELKIFKKHASTYCYHTPSHVQLELTTRCNLRCKWCNQASPEWQKQYGHKDMPYEKFEEIIVQLKGTKRLLLYNIGEPLLYKRIYDAIALAKKYIPEVRLTSNGILLTATAAKRLEQAGLDMLHISIDSPDPVYMQNIRGADLKVIEDNIHTFAEVCNIPVEIWVVVSEQTLETLKDMPKWASQFKAITRIRFQLQKGMHTVADTGFNPLQSLEVYQDFQRVIDAECKRLGIASNIYELPFYREGYHQQQTRGICQAPFTQLVAISVRGEINPCCTYDSCDLGNIFENGFKSVWNGPQMRAWREDMLQQRYCQYCSNWCGFKKHDNRDKAIPAVIVVNQQKQ